MAPPPPSRHRFRCTLRLLLPSLPLLLLLLCTDNAPWPPLAAAAAAPNSTAGPASCVDRDRDALLAFKAGLQDPIGELSTWTATGDCCASFTGVTCAAASGEVTQLVLVANDEDGCEDCPVLGTPDGATTSRDLVGSTLGRLAALEVLDLTNLRLRDVVPQGLERALPRLRVLSLVNLGLHGPLPPALGSAPALEVVQVADGNPEVSGGVPAAWCALGRLRELVLAESDLTRLGAKSGPLPACLGQLAALQVLDVQYNQFSGSLTPELARLAGLRELKVTGNAFGGGLPAVGAGQWQSLEVVWAQGNAFVGGVPAGYGGLKELRELRVGGLLLPDGSTGVVEVTGPIPASLGRLTKLQVLVIESTLVSGSIPASLAQLPALTDLLLSNNRLSGPIPAAFGSTGSLVNLQLNDNRLSGRIPASLGGTGKNLTTIFAARNLLTGPIPESLSELQLGDLDLSSNFLTGAIPAGLGAAFRFFSPGFRRLYLNNNLLTGSLTPASLWTGIDEILLHHNALTSLGTGSIPDDNIGTGQNVFVFDASHNALTGAIPPWIFQMRNANLDLSSNALTSLPPTLDADGPRYAGGYVNLSRNLIAGPIPAGFTRMFNLNFLDLSSNRLTGPVLPGFGDPAAQQFLAVLDLGDNRLSGALPPGIFGGGNLKVLVVRGNRLSGRVPEREALVAGGAAADSLEYVDLSGNALSGPVPASLVAGSALRKIRLGNNRLSGGVPDFGGACAGGLESFEAQGNLLTGPVVPEGVDLGACGKLVVYDVSGNLLSGAIPPAIASFTALQVLGLSRNALTGPVPPSLVALHALRVLRLAHTNLTGALPLPALAAGFTALRSAATAAAAQPYRRTPGGAPLYTDGVAYGPGVVFGTRTIQFVFASTTAIDLSGNALTGPIDGAAVGSLQGLRVLDLSHNRLSGAVPAAIARIPHLDALDLSFNLLAGRIPAALAGFPAADFAGNPGLCGRPLPNACP